MESSSDESVQKKPTKSKNNEVILIKAPKRERKPLTEKQLQQLSINRGKALETLTKLRREKADLKVKQNLENETLRVEIETKKLDKAPKVKELDDSFTLMKNEIEALKKQLNEKPVASVPSVTGPVRKVKRIIYDDEDDIPKKKEVLTGNDLLDKLFFS